MVSEYIEYVSTEDEWAYILSEIERCSVCGRFFGVIIHRAGFQAGSFLIGARKHFSGVATVDDYGVMRFESGARVSVCHTQPRDWQFQYAGYEITRAFVTTELEYNELSFICSRLKDRSKHKPKIIVLR